MRRVRDYQNAYRARNPEAVKRWSDAAYRRDVERSREGKRNAYKRNKPAFIEQGKRRRAARLSAVPPWFGELDQLASLEAIDLAARREAATGFAWHVDHMIPLQARQACGLHCASNLQVIPQWMNLRKGNKLQLTERGEWVRFA